jgi:glycosyltransferase involved in cell wall biosynthesis
VIATSVEQAERQFGYGGPDASNVVVLRSAISESFIERCRQANREAARESLGVGDAFVFSIHARLAWDKGIDRVIRAMAQLDDTERETVLVIAGDGPERAGLEELVNSLGLSERVTFLGHRNDIEAVLAAADASVLALTALEPQPLGLKEAMAAARPVIASRIGGVPEFITHGVDGLLIDDDDELVAAMRELSADPARAARIGQRGQETILADHRLKTRMKYLLAVLDRQAIRVLPLEMVLKEFTWGKVRWRNESETGFLFVPRTSEITELPMPIYSVIKEAIQHGTPADLLALPAAETKDMAELLFNMGAMVRSAQHVTLRAA